MNPHYLLFAAATLLGLASCSTAPTGADAVQVRDLEVSYLMENIAQVSGRAYNGSADRVEVDLVCRADDIRQDSIGLGRSRGVSIAANSERTFEALVTASNDEEIDSVNCYAR